jgi:FixJ family two-component response regulator
MLVRDRWNPETEGRACLRVGGGPEHPTVRGNDRTADRQADADAVRRAIELDRLGRLKHAERTRRRELYASLTGRERQVLGLVVVGRLNKQIAAELNLSESTVKLHRAEVMQKMEVSSVAELVSIVADLDIVSRS